MTGDGVGLTEIVFILGLCAFALWKTSWIRVLLAICIIIWGVFTVPTDAKIAGPLLAIGTVLFIIGIMNVIGKYRETT